MPSLFAYSRFHAAAPQLPLPVSVVRPQVFSFLLFFSRCNVPARCPFVLCYRMSKRLVGAVDEYDGDRFFTRLGGKGKTVATPLLLCLVCIELSDFVFAVDSIPAVLGISQARGGGCVGLMLCLC